MGCGHPPFGFQSVLRNSTSLVALAMAFPGWALAVRERETVSCSLLVAG